MPYNKPLLLYAPLWDFVAESFVDKMNDIPQDQDIDIWMNCPGGRVFAGWSIIGPIEKRTGKKNLSIFGHSMSMAVYFALYCDHVEALEVSQFMLHRAHGYVDNPDDQKLLDNINKDLRKQMESRLNMDVFEKVCGCTLDDIFNSEERRDIMLTAKDAKKIGLIDKIIKLSKPEMESYAEKFVAFADFSQRSENNSQRSEADVEINSNHSSKKLKKMTIQEFKSQNPEGYQEIFELGKKAGKKAEAVRTKSWIAYIDIDKENVISSIKEEKEFTPDVMAEMSVKMASKSTAANIQADSAGDISTDKPEDKTAEQKEAETFEANVKKNVESIKVV